MDGPKPVQGKSQPTIIDIAREAGVSKSTVSRVLNGQNGVSEQARYQVLQAARRLGYTPNGLARGLSGRHTAMVGFVLSDISNPFFPELARGIEDVAREMGYTVLFANTDGRPDREHEAVRLLVERRVDGIVFASVTRETDCLRWLREVGIPFALAGRSTDDPDVDSVVVDNVAGGRMATEHLLGLGHSRVAFIGGPRNVSASVERFEGYRQAFRARNLEVDPRLVRWADFRQSGGYVAALELLQGTGEPPTALFAANDQMAIGALDAALELGLEVPDQLALVGFDDIPVAGLRALQLTTVAQPKYEIGSLAMRMVAGRIEERRRRLAGGGARRVVLAPSLVVRRTCGALRVSPADRLPAGPLGGRARG